MHDVGMITDEQYAYVLANGCLPGGSAVTNSPVPVEKQNGWERLAKHKVVTADELAYVYFKGKMPHMTDAEHQAFADLAEVYEPVPAKRVKYALRRKHQKVELIRLKYRAHEKWTTNYAEAVRKAEATGLPLRFESNGSVAALVGWENGMPIYNGTCNRIAAQTISTDKVHPGGPEPFALTGTNITLAIWDEGEVWSDHPEFYYGQVSIGNDVEDSSLAVHSTAVAGTMVANGWDLDAKGMAPEARLASYDFLNLIEELTDCAENHPNIQISNHSYNILCGWRNEKYLNRQIWFGDPQISEIEDYKFGWYGDVSRDMDNFCYIWPYHLPVFASGNDRTNRQQTTESYYVNWALQTNWNDVITSSKLIPSSTNRPPNGNPTGFDCISLRGTSKNILTVGAVKDIPSGYTNGMEVLLDPYSSTGPTDDGRIKPDVVANGNLVHTCNYPLIGWTMYKDWSGTSFAAPGVSGSLGLVQQLYEQIHGTNVPLLASTYKGIAIHTAHDIGPTGPDYTFGWGLFDTPSACWAVSNNATWNSLPFIKEVRLPEGEIIEFNVVATSNETFKATIVWTDPPGPVQPVQVDPTNRVLVHDLDLRVIDSMGTTNYPWILDPFNPTNLATTGDNVLDNVEQVELPPVSTNTVYTIRIRHKGILATNHYQDVSILLSGNIPGNSTSTPALFISSSNGTPILTWEAVVGATYELENNANLSASHGWSTNRVSAFREDMQWEDTSATNETVQFYKSLRRTE